jgi:hypothetical protein
MLKKQHLLVFVNTRFLKKKVNMILRIIIVLANSSSNSFFFLFLYIFFKEHSIPFIIIFLFQTSSIFDP